MAEKKKKPAGTAPANPSNTILPGGKYLDRFKDEGMPIDMGWTQEAEEELQQARVKNLAIMGLHIALMKRRLGGDAEPHEMRTDKRRGRQLRGRMENIIAMWGGARADITEEYEILRQQFPTPMVLIDASQLDWGDWWLKHRVFLQNEARRVATHATAVAGHKVANKMVYRLEYEYQQLDDFLGEITANETNPWRFDPNDPMEMDETP